MIYRVLNWERVFENNKSRERDACSFVCVPNKQHGMSFSRIMAEPDGGAIYGIWCLILGACSQQKKPRAGWLTEDGHQTGTPWAPSDLALKFRRPEAEITRALDFLCSPKIGWMEGEKTSQDVDSKPSKNSARSVPVDCPSTATEEKRIEEKRSRAPVGAATTSETRLFTDGWMERFKAAHNQPYKFSGAKDGKATSELLKLGLPVETLLDIAEGAWRLNGDHEWERTMAFQISSFSSQFNAISLVVKAQAKAVPKTDYRPNGVIRRPSFEEAEAARKEAQG